MGAHAVNPKIKEKWDGSNKIEGNANVIVLPDGSKLRGHYVLTEAGAATASHDASNGFEPTEGFPVDENGQSVNDRDYSRDKDAQRMVDEMANGFDSRALQSPVIVSQDGVVLSGNNRTMSGDIAAKQGTDKAYVDHLREFGQMYGFAPEQIDGMQHPRVVFVPDEPLPYDAATFARFNAETQKRQSKPEHAVKLGKIVPDNVFGSIATAIGGYDRLSDFYADSNAVNEVLKRLFDAGVINEMQLPELRTGNALSAAGKELIENLLVGKAFQGAPDAVRQLIAEPNVKQAVVMALSEIAHNRTLEKSGYSLGKELAAAIDLVYRARRSNPDMYKNGVPVSPFGRQLGLFDGQGDQAVTDGAVLLLADLLSSGKTSDLRKVLAAYNAEATESASGQADIFSGKVLSKEEILKTVTEHFKNATRGEQKKLVDAAVDKRKQAAAERGGRGKESEQTEHAAERGEKGGSREPTGGGRPDSQTYKVDNQGNPIDNEEETPLSEQIATASADVNTEPTEGQKEAGNYKKGHVQVGAFDITIEQPKGSVRKGTDANGKQWESKMHNTYGYFRGTEGVDGDHIDVFLSNDIDGWNGHKVYVVDQYNPDGTFDEHKVMLGFNDADEAKSDYLANHEKGWETGRRIDVSAVNLEDFEKWIGSSHRKTKPFAEYVGVKKETVANVPAKEEAAAQTDNNDNITDEEIENAAFTLGVHGESQTLMRLELDNTPERAKQILDAAKKWNEKNATAAPTDNAAYTITPTTYTNKKGKTTDMSLLKFDNELTPEQERAVKEFAKERTGEGRFAPTRGWKDRESGGWMFRSEEDARKAAEMVGGNEAKTEQAETKQDNQGNPLNADGTLKLEKVTSVDDLTDEDFSAPTRNVELPTLPKNVDDAIGANGKPVVIKKNIFERNAERHSDLTAEDSRNILMSALFSPNLYGQNQKAKRPYNWVVINTKDEQGKNRLVLLEINPNKNNIEIIHWQYARDTSLEQIKRQAENEGGQILILPSDTEEAGGLSSLIPGLSSESKDTTKSVTKQPKPTDNKDKEAPQDKIDDVGEHIAGARKDALAKLSQSVADVTLESLIELPASKAFKRPDLKKAVKEGALRETDARFAEAVMAAYLGTAKPKLKEGYKRASSEEAVRAWAEYAKEGVDMLARLFSLDEAGRDKFMAEVRSRKAYSEEEVRERQRQLEQWNPGRKYNGTCYPLNPVDVLARVMERLGYEPGAKVALPVVAAAPDSGFGQYVLTTRNGKSYYPGRRLTTIDDVVDEIVYAAKVENADQDTDHPAGKFSVGGVGEPLKVSTGKWLVVTQRSLTAAVERHTFDSKEEAEAFAQKFLEGRGKYRYASKPTEEARTTGYSQYEIVYKHENPTKGTYAYMSTGKVYGSLEEARAAIDGEHDELNSVVNAKLAEEKGKSGEGNKKDYLKIVSYTEDGRTWKYGVVLADKYAPKIGALDTMPFYLGDGFSTLKEAQAFVDEHREEWDAKVSEIDKARRGFVYFNGTGERTGKDWRKGADVSAGQLMEQFGFRGVQFGNWTNQRDRQAAVNGAFDALMDLAQILGVSPRALSLNGELGLAFGSRGGGSAAAHYEPGEVVINLTKTQGAGSLAHEWWHALDNYFARHGDVKNGMVTEVKGIAMRDELREAFNALIDSVAGSDYNKRSRARGASYWGRPTEETARLFAAWVNDELQKRGMSSPFLSDTDPGAAERYAEAMYMGYKMMLGDKAMTLEEFKKTPLALSGFVYPSTEELATFGRHLRNIFNTVQEKVDEQTGNTLLYHRGPVVALPDEAEQALLGAVSDVLKGTGIEVVTDVDEGQRVLDLGNERPRMQKVYHGSGADFEEFDHSHMGEGSGMQAHGWGTYVLVGEGSARGYAVADAAERNEGKTILEWHGQETDVDSLIEELAEAHPETFGEWFERKWDNIYRYHFEHLLDRIMHGKDVDEYVYYRMRDEGSSEKERAFWAAVYRKVLPHVSVDMPYHRNLYEAQIPDNNGRNYIEEYKTYSSRTSLRRGIEAALKERGIEGLGKGSMTGREIYVILTDVLGGKKEASRLLQDLGIVGVHYYRQDDGESYVIFNERDARITDHVRFFRTPDGEAYGFTVGGKIYVDPRIARADTPIHEYTHLWSDMMRRVNPKAWADIVRLMKGKDSLWNWVKENYPELKTDDEIADEVLARFSGKRGAERLREEMRKAAEGGGSVTKKAAAVSALLRVKEALGKFWRGVAELLHIRFTTAEEVADRVMADMLHGVDPRKVMDGGNPDEGMRFRLLDDDDPQAQELEALPESELVPVYRNVQVFDDDTLGSPMAFSDAATGERRTLKGGKWNYSEPREVKLTPEQQKQLDELNRNGYLTVNGKRTNELPIGGGLKFVKPKTKPAQLQYFLKKSPEDSGLWAAYNPYDHAIETPLNTQFGEAYKRPNLVVVRSLMPKSELEGHYKADYAKDSTGAHKWNNGRTLYLSRYSKIDKVLTREEEAQLIDEYWKKNPGKREALASHRDYRRFVPEVRKALEKMGYRFEFDGRELTPEEALELDRQQENAEPAIPGEEGRIPRVNAEDIARINAKMSGKWVGEPKETLAQAMVRRVKELAAKLGAKVRIVTSADELGESPTGRQRKMKGMYDTETGEITIVVGNHENLADVENTMLHEAVGHGGFRVLFDTKEKLAHAMDELYRVSGEKIRKWIDGKMRKLYDSEVDSIMARKRKEREARGEKPSEHHLEDMAAAHIEASSKKDEFRRIATEEYGANLAGRIGEKGFGKLSAEEQTFWGRLKSMLQKALQRLSEGLNITGKHEWTDKDWAYVLHEAYKREKNGGKPSIFDKADTIAMRMRTGFGEGERKQEERKNEEEDPDAGMMFRDGDDDDIGDVSLGDAVNKMRDAAVESNANNLHTKREAMKAIGGNLSKLRQAMSRQKVYDKGTVKSVTDMAREMLQNGMLDKLSSYEAKRILSAAANVTGAENTTRQINKLMDVMVDNQLRNAADTFGKLLHSKGTRVNASGVEVQGKLDPDGAAIVDVLKKGVQLDKDELNERIAKVLDKIGSEDKAIADQAANELTGLQLAARYAEDIKGSKTEEAELRESLKEAKAQKDAGQMGAEAYKQYCEATEDAMRQNKIERADAYRQLIAQLGGVMGESAERAKAWREAEKQRVQDIQHNANSDMQGRPCNEHHKPSSLQKLCNSSIVRFFLQPLATFEQMMRMFGNKNVRGEGYLWNRFVRGWLRASENEYSGYRDALKELDDKVSEIFGKKMRWGDIFSLERKMPTMEVSFWDGGEMKHHTLTQGNLAYIYMVDKMSDGRMKLRAMGITDEAVEQITKALDPRLRKLADWMQDEFLVQRRNKYNEVHKRMFGASMAAIENYFPLKILSGARTENVDVADDTGEPTLTSTTTGSIIKRRRNNLALDVTNADAFSVILEHLQDMEHWAAYSEFNRDLNTLLSYKRFKNQVMNMSSAYGAGETLWKNFRNVCQLAAGSYRPPVAPLDKAAVNFAKGVTAAKVSFRIFTAIKQLLSFPAYLPDASAKYLVQSLANPVSAWKWSMENLPLFHKRWNSRMAGDPRLLKTEMDWKMWRSRAVQLASKYGMSPNAFVDAVTVAMGAHAIYKTKLAKYIKQGYDKNKAEEKARQDAEITYNLTQQSSEGALLSTMQADRSWLSVLFTVFRNSSMSYTRQEYDALRNLARRITKPQYKQMSVEFMAKQMMRDGLDESTATRNAKREYNRSTMRDFVRVATFGYILQLMWNLGAYLPYLLLGDNDDEKKKMLDDAGLHALMGSVEGLTGGDVMSTAGQYALTGEGDPEHLTKEMPLTSDLYTIYEKFGYDKMAACNDVLNLLVQAGVGVNPQSLTDAVVGVMDYCDADPKDARECALLIARIFNTPQSQLDKIYFDEIDLDGSNASKLSPQQIAERYAKYKLKRNAPLTSRMYGEDGRKERVAKYEDAAYNKAKEKLSAWADSRSGEDLTDWFDEYKQSVKTVRRINKLQFRDPDKFDEEMARFEDTPAAERYHKISDYMQQISDLTKQWQSAKTRAERMEAANEMVTAKKDLANELKTIK